MIWAFIGFAAAFVVGAILTIVGGAGVELKDCPAIISAFPSHEPGCNSFSVLVFAGGSMTIIGGVVASGILTFGKLPD